MSPAGVDVSIQRESTQLFWDGSSFSSATEMHLPAVGSGSWSYALPASAFTGSESYTVRARASDSAGLTSVDSVSIAFDRTAPVAPTITSGPSGTTSGFDTFIFTGEPGARFECQLDAGSWATCTSPKTYESLADGPHTFAVRAVDTAGNTGAPTNRSWTVDATAPTVGITFPAAGGRYNDARYDAGCVAATGDVCGTASDTAGVAKVEVSVQRASTDLYLSGSTFGSQTPTWTMATGTTSWNYALAASTFPAGDTYRLFVRATDAVGNARTSSTAFVIDRTKPTASGFSTTNVLGGTVRKLEVKDTFTLTFSEPVDPGSIITGWNGTTTQTVVVRATGSGGSQDRLTVYAADNTTLLPLGTVNLNRTDYVAGATTFGLTGTPSTLTMSGAGLTVTLGTPSRTPGTAAGAANATWTPALGVLDLAGNAAAANAFTETDTDSDF
jgi:hypothetical protein